MNIKVIGKEDEKRGNGAIVNTVTCNISVYMYSKYSRNWELSDIEYPLHSLLAHQIASLATRCYGSCWLVTAPIPGRSQTRQASHHLHMIEFKAKATQPSRLAMPWTCWRIYNYADMAQPGTFLLYVPWPFRRLLVVESDPFINIITQV